jgi:hypothetical protein
VTPAATTPAATPSVNAELATPDADHQHTPAASSVHVDGDNAPLSSGPIGAFDLEDKVTMEELRAAVSEADSVLELHQADPVAGMEVWKAMSAAAEKKQRRAHHQLGARRASVASSVASSAAAMPAALAASPKSIPGMHRNTRRTDEVAAIVSRRRQEIAELHATSQSGMSILANQARDERQTRLRRASAYPQRVLLAMDSTVAACPAVELKRRAQAVEAESKRFDNDIKRWRAAMEREPDLPDVGEEHQLQLLEGELLEAKLEDLSARADALEAAVRQQGAKHAVLLRHATKLLGAEVVDGDIPPVETADDLRTQLKATLVDIRDTKYQREQTRQQQRRAINRADRKVEALEAQLKERQEKAIDEANRALTAEDDRIALLQARHDKRAAARTEAAIESLVASEEAQRAELERAAGADLRVIKADAQSSLLNLRAKRARENADAAVPISDSPAFAMASTSSSPSRSRGGRGGARR